MTKRKKGYILILVAALLFSTTEIALKLAGGSFHPMQLSAERMMLGGLFLLPLALRSLKERQLHLTRSDWLYFAALGFVTVMLHTALFQMALMRLDASAAAAIYSGNPVFAVVTAHLILGEKLRKNHLAAIILEVVGIFFILNLSKQELDPAGVAEVLVATSFFAAYGTLCKLRTERLGSAIIACMCMLFGAAELLLSLLPGRIPSVASALDAAGLGLFANVPLTTGFTLRSTMVFIYTGVVCAGIGYLLMARISEYTSAIEASFIYLLKPVLATLLGHAVMRDVISMNRVIGVAFFLAASTFVIVPELLNRKKEI